MKNQKRFFSIHQRKISGFSLLEVFLSITISLILLAGVLQIFLNAKTTYNLESGFTQLQETGRFIEQYIVKTIRLAGYRTPQGQSNNFIAMTTVFPTTLPFISGSDGSGINGSDTLVIRYQGSGNGAGTPDGTIVDCLNVPVDANTMVTNTFSLTANLELQCRAQNPNSATPDNTQILISGVENFQVLYGEDTNGDDAADRYVPANYASLNWANVVSIRLSLLLRSDNQVNPFTENRSFYMLGTTYTPATADRYLRNQLTFTVVLRNLIAKTD